MRSSLPSISLAAITTFIINMNGVKLLETIIFAFVGGAIGYLGKLFIELLIKQIKKLKK